VFFGVSIIQRVLFIHLSYDNIKISNYEKLIYTLELRVLGDTKQKSAHVSIVVLAGC
jgi:hypothetical protein